MSFDVGVIFCTSRRRKETNTTIKGGFNNDWKRLFKLTIQARN